MYLRRGRVAEAQELLTAAEADMPAELTFAVALEDPKRWHLWMTYKILLREAVTAEPWERIEQTLEGSVDLLALVDPEPQVLHAQWRPGDDGGYRLHPPTWLAKTKRTAIGRSGVALPVSPRGSYRVRGAFTRIEDGQQFAILLPVGERRVMLTLDHNGQGIAGLSVVSGRRIAPGSSNPTVCDCSIETGRRYRFEANVRLDGEEASVDVTLDGKALIQWSGRQSDLNVGPRWEIGDPRDLAVVTRGDFVIHDLELEMLDGEAFHVTYRGEGPEAARERAGRLFESWRDRPGAASSPEKETGEGRGGSLQLAAGNSFDVLAAVDPSTAISGWWEKRDGALTSDAAGYAKLQLPVEVGGSYELVIRVTRQRGPDSLNLMLPVGGRGCMLVLDGWPSRETQQLSGLDLVDGQPGIDNETTYGGLELKNNQEHKLVVRVLNGQPQAGLAVIVVEADGAPIIRWQGDKSRLELDGNWDLPEDSRLGIGGYNSAFEFREITLTPLDGHSLLWQNTDADAGPAGDGEADE